ncbi:glycosyltransferase family 2 protein [Candidatus Woesearchaeota archaeon]|nr:glycosyltransferase family 2 protein [Candidatus Woesearchaeota archaeon]
MQQPRVLIGCVTCDQDEQFLDQFMEAAHAQDNKNFDVLFVDNSVRDAYFERLKRTGARCIRDTAGGITIVKITRGRNMIREYALAHDYDYLFFVDTDIVIPRFALSRLLSHGKDIACGVYLSEINYAGHKFVAPILFDFGDEESGRIYNVRGVVRDRLIEVAATGFGCMLLSRRVLQDIGYRYNPAINSGEDILFCLDARAKGYKIYCDTSVKCDHYGYPPQDKRNSKQLWQTYLTV